MRMMWVAAVALSATASFAAAGEQTVSVKSGNDTVSAFLATPDGPGPFPALVVIQEWWGLNDWIKGQARALAREGYVALAPDLYRGKVATKQEEAHQLMMGMPPERAAADVAAAFAALAARPDVKKDRIGAIGWCMGGGYALRFATTQPALAAVVAYYGTPPGDAAAVAAIKAPVLGNYGADDKGPTADLVRAFEAALKKDGKTVDVKIYDGAGHAFANPDNPWGGYRAAAASDAWARTSAFLAKYLKK